MRCRLNPNFTFQDGLAVEILRSQRPQATPLRIKKFGLPPSPDLGRARKPQGRGEAPPGFARGAGREWPSPFKKEVGLPPQSNAAGTATTESTAKLRLNSLPALLLAALVLASAPAFPGPPEPAQGTLELHFLNKTVEEGTWSSESPSVQDLKPFCGAIEIYTTYSAPADSLVLFVDDLQVDVRNGSEARFIWDTKGWPDGFHELKVQVLAEQGQPGPVFSFPVETRTEKDTTPPEVAIASPPNLSVVRGIVSVSVDARDDHDVAKVWLLVDGVKLGEGASHPYKFSWDTRALPSGSEHKLEAKAADSSGNEGASPLVTVSVSNPIPLLKNSRLEGTPPLPWKASKGLLLERKSDQELGAFARMTAVPPFASGDLEQEFSLTKPAADAVISLKHRWGAALAAPNESPGACKVELHDADGKAVFSWTCPADASDAPAWSETALALPALQPGRYTLRLVVLRPSGASPYFDVSQADVVMQ